MLFSELAKLYLADKRDGRKAVRANTLEGYMGAVSNHLLPRWGQEEVEAIGFEDVQSWVDSFPEGRGAEKAYKTLRQIIRWAISRLHVRIADPTVGVLLPERPRRAARVATEGELNRLLLEMQGQDWEPVVLCQACLGLRRCEACALTWADVNLATGVVSVTKGRHVVGGRVLTWGTKTPKSTREVVLPWFAVERLREIRRERRARPSELLCDERPDAIGRRFRSWCRTHGHRGLTMMQLRHTFATLAVRAGVPIEVVAMMLGHTDISMCYARYVASSEGLFRSAMRRWSDLVLKAAPPTRLDDVSPIWGEMRRQMVAVQTAA